MSKKRVNKRTRDVIYTLMIGFAIIAFWRGVWGLMDLYFFPNNPVWSFSSSILLGIIILYSTKNLIKRLI